MTETAGKARRAGIVDPIYGEQGCPLIGRSRCCRIERCSAWTNVVSAVDRRWIVLTAATRNPTGGHDHAFSEAGQLSPVGGAVGLRHKAGQAVCRVAGEARPLTPVLYERRSVTPTSTAWTGPTSSDRRPIAARSSSVERRPAGSGGSRAEQFEQIRRDRDREGSSIRALAERHGVHRRVVCASSGSPLPPTKRRPVSRLAPKLGGYRELIDECLLSDLEAPRKRRTLLKTITLADRAVAFPEANQTKPVRVR